MLIGRSAETAALERLLASAREGRSGVLVIRGEAGVGKSALLEHALEVAEGMTVLRGLGIESESELAYAALHQILRPVLDRIDELPEPQAAALRAAFALSAETVDDRFRVSLGALSLLAEAAEERPVLCLVDDAQWLDQPSADALVFAARRLVAEPLVLLFAARDHPEHPFAARGLSDLRLSALGAADARALVASRLGDQAAPTVVDWLVDSAGGNPLALVELPALLSAPQLAGTEALAGPLERGTSVEQVYLERVEALPPATRRVLLVAAAEGTGSRAAVERAADELGLEIDDLAAAESVGLVQVDAERVVFRHPLVRSAVYRGATFAEREGAHRMLAVASAAAGEADRAAWHRAVATVGTDDAASPTSSRRLRSGRGSGVVMPSRRPRWSVRRR